MTESCYFCTETERLEEHHIVPRRFDGSDTDENIVTVCPTCHSKLENLYNSRFYDRLNVTKDAKQQHPECEYCSELADGQSVNWTTSKSIYACEECAEIHGVRFEVEI